MRAPTSSLNLARFDFVSVKLAVTCAQTGSLTAAARENNLALAAASRRIRELEAALGDALFERHPKGLTLTPAGRIFLKYGLTLLQNMDQLGHELTDLRQGIARHIRVCASTAAINQFLPPLLAQWNEQYPQVRIELEEQVSAAVVAALREGRADIGVFVEGADISGLHTCAFRKDELVVLFPSSHPLAKTPARQAVTFESLLDEQWIGLSTGAAMLQPQQQAALAAGKPLKIRMQLRSFDAVCHMVEAGLGLTVLPKTSVMPILRAMKLSTRPLTNSWAQRTLLLGTATALSDPGVDAFRDFLIKKK